MQLELATEEERLNHIFSDTLDDRLELVTDLVSGKKRDTYIRRSFQKPLTKAFSFSLFTHKDDKFVGRVKLLPNYYEKVDDLCMSLNRQLRKTIFWPSTTDQTDS